MGRARSDPHCGGAYRCATGPGCSHAESSASTPLKTFSPPASADQPPVLTRDQLVAGSAGWLAASLNLGCQGIGYIYQRRWKAFWLGALAASGAAVLLGGGLAVLVMSAQPQGQEEKPELIVGSVALGAYLGVLAVGVGSAVEAGVAVKRARQRLGR